MKKSVAAIVLAAGRSTRMGHQNKLSTPLARGAAAFPCADGFGII